MSYVALSTRFSSLNIIPLLLSALIYTSHLHAKTLLSLILLMAIRVGVIGLSANAKTSWASSAHLPYLQASGGKYVITALCNSSVSAAQSAIEAYDLPASIKAYGNPQDLAHDSEV